MQLLVICLAYCSETLKMEAVCSFEMAGTYTALYSFIPKKTVLFIS
jgi:hypothetical protein